MLSSGLSWRLTVDPLGPAGFEHTPLAAPKPAISEEARTRDSTPDARDPDLAELIARWPDLPGDIKRRIMTLVRGHADK